MIWDRKNKKKLYLALESKIPRLVELAPDPFVLEAEWERFLDSHGIVQVERASAKNPWRGVGRQMVAISDPWLAKSDFVLDRNGECRDPSCYGLGIPNEVAEKFLILGVP